MARYRLTYGREHRPEWAVVLYERNYRTKLTTIDRRRYVRGYRRGTLLYWIDRVKTLSRQIDAGTIDRVTRVLKAVVDDKRVIVQHTQIKDARNKIDARVAQVIEDPIAANDELLDMLKYRIVYDNRRYKYRWLMLRDEIIIRDSEIELTRDDMPKFYEDVNAILDVAKNYEGFWVKYRDGLWQVRLGIKDGRIHIPVMAKKLEIALMAAVLVRYDEHEQR